MSGESDGATERRSDEGGGTSVAIVVDRGFGERLVALADRMPVWICDTEVNHPVAERIWRAPGRATGAAGVTTFKVGADDAPEQMVLDVLSTVDLHHGPCSCDPPWSAMEVHGASLNEKIGAALAEYGVDEIADIESGFIARRRGQAREGAMQRDATR